MTRQSFTISDVDELDFLLGFEAHDTFVEILAAIDDNTSDDSEPLCALVQRFDEIVHNALADLRSETQP